MIQNETNPESTGMAEPSDQRPNKDLVSNNSSNDLVTLVKGIVGACLGGVAGYFVFMFLYDQGLYAIVLPGAAVGIGCGLFARSDKLRFAVIGGVLSLVATIPAEFNTTNVVDANGNEQGWVYFVSHLIEYQTSLLSFVLNGIIGFWLGRRG